MDSKNGTVIKPTGTAAMDKTPNNLFGMTLNALKVGKKYHSGKISNGVANGSPARRAGRFHNRQGDTQRDGTQDDDRENVQQIVRPRRFTVVVVTHTLHELSSQNQVGQVGLFSDRVGDDQGARRWI